MPKSPRKLLSVIMPAFRQERTILDDIRRVRDVLKTIRYDWEILVVVDGGKDKTFSNARKIRSPKVHVYRLKQNRGKGYAVRFGMRQAKGDYILFLDSGMEIDPNGISMLIEHLEWYDADIIVGSKRHPVSVIKYPMERKILSTGYYLLVWLLFGVKIKDTQPGIKIFRKAVLEKLLPVLIVKRYAFDIELITVAQSLGFTRIYEAPIKIEYKFDSLTNAATLKAIWHMFWDTLGVFYRLHIDGYYRRMLSKKNLL